VITIKSAREIEIMRRSGKITARTLSMLMKTVRAGMTTADIDRLAEESIRSMGGVPTFIGYHGFKHSICLSVNEEVVHGIPGPRVLHDGDILSLDLGTTLDGYVSDSAVTVAIGSISAEAERLMRVTQECLMFGIAQMQVGNRTGDIGHAVQEHAERHGYGVVRQLVGHGVGTKLHEEPQVPNFGTAGTGTPLRAGLVLAIEPMITEGTYEVETLADGWTVVTGDGKLSAHFEHTIVVTNEGPKILTLRDYAEHEDVVRYIPKEEIAA
jgi:methionyl aminopeptidase